MNGFALVRLSSWHLSGQKKADALYHRWSRATSRPEKWNLSKVAADDGW